jgi:hypothetical protein
VGDRVRVCAATDVGIYDVRRYFGRVGTVQALRGDLGCGEHLPDDPFVEVRLEGGSVEVFWREELTHWCGGEVPGDAETRAAYAASDSDAGEPDGRRDVPWAR